MSRKISDESIAFLQDELYSSINMLKLAELALENEEDELLPTAIEEAFYKLQLLVDEFCVVRELMEE